MTLTPIQYLELCILRAKSVGDALWSYLELIPNIKNKRYDVFAGMCDAFGNEYGPDDKELGQLLALEMFLRAGKHMEPAVKLENRKLADSLYSKILQRDK